MSASPIRIDAHQHFWDPAEFDYPWMEGDALDPVRRPFGPDELRPELERSGIDGTVLVQTVSDIAETRRFLDIAETTPFVFGVVGWVDLTGADVGDRLDELLAGPGRLAGIRHQVHDEPDSEWLDRMDVRRAVAEIGARGLSYDLLVRTRELGSATRLVRAFPDQRFVLDHIAKPPIAAGWSEEWSSGLATLAGHPNVSVKLSGMVTEADWMTWNPETLRPYVERVLDAFGPDRAMFGSDWPVCLLAAPNYGSVIDALTTVLDGLSTSEREGVFGVNAARWYNLGDVSA
jgi:L-fuconolactonase